MNTGESQAEWVRRAHAEHAPALVRFAASLTGDPEAARDIVQDTFVRLWAETPERLNGCLAPWLFTVCRHRALDHRRKSAPMQPLPDLSDQPADAPDPAAATADQDDAGLALRLLAALPANQREVLRLKLQAGLSYAEISEVTGLSTGNVGFLLHTGLKTLRARLRRAL
jgi:RNA polymerase sigma-70 factor (ECF subfamily)